MYLILGWLVVGTLIGLMFVGMGGGFDDTDY